MDTITPFVRYALLVLAGLAARGDWLPAHIGEEIANDPIVIEMAVSVVIGAVTLFWYIYSTSRKALKEAVGK